MENENLLKALQAPEGNFSYYFKMNQDKIEALLKLKDDENEAWLKKTLNSWLESREIMSLCFHTVIKFSWWFKF